MRLHVHEWGEGPPVLCLHGVTGHGERFAGFAERWSGFRVLAPDLIETLDDLGIEQADWVGHSFGGRLVLEAAAAHPERIRRAVLLDPAIDLLPNVAAFMAEQERAEPIFASPQEYRERRNDPTAPPELVEADGVM